MIAAAIIPAFNEAETIGDVIRGLRGAVDHILIVDEGSTDAMADVVKPLEYPAFVEASRYRQARTRHWSCFSHQAVETESVADMNHRRDRQSREETHDSV